ncbi:MAG: hypothetical protein V1690_03295 [Candidatus Moraniibacteriota bacterium]
MPVIHGRRVRGCGDIITLGNLPGQKRVDIRIGGGARRLAPDSYVGTMCDPFRKQEKPSSRRPQNLFIKEAIGQKIPQLEAEIRELTALAKEGYSEAEEERILLEELLNKLKQKLQEKETNN